MHPLHTEAWLKEAENCGIPRAHIIHRGTGKSTVQSLRVLANAIQNPGVVFRVADHHGTPRATELQLQMIRDMVDKLNLQHIHINRTDQTIVFENRERDKLPLGEDSSQCPDDDSYYPPRITTLPPGDMLARDTPTSALDKQEGGAHYKDHAIQPIEYIHANKLGFIEGNVVKYITRHASKGGAEDVRKVIHYCELLLQLQYGVKP